MFEEIKSLKGKDLYNYLVKNKDMMIQQKKMLKTKSQPFEINNIASKTVKFLNSQYEDDLQSGVITRDIIANTYNWMDSHYDVHVGSTFKKSIKERSIEDTWHLHDHDFKTSSKVGEFKSIVEKEVDWLDLGKNISGTTKILMPTSDIIMDYNKSIYKQYLTNKIKQHSVGMIYVKIFLAINDPEYKEEYAVFQKYINDIGNQEKAIEAGFFWAVPEAKLVEVSTVLEASCELTDTVPNEPSTKDTQSNSNSSAVEDSHTEDTDNDKEEQRKAFMKSLIT